MRTGIGEFSLSEATALDQLTSENWPERLLPPRRAVEHLPWMRLSDEQVVEIRAGRAIAVEGVDCESEIAADDAEGRLVALLKGRGPGRVGPVRVFSAGK